MLKRKKKKKSKKKKRPEKEDLASKVKSKTLQETLGMTLDSKSQWIVSVLEAVDVRRLADELQIRRNIWRRFWDRLLEEEEYSKPRYRKGTRPLKTVRPEPPNHLNPNLLNWDVRQGVAMVNAPPLLLDFDGSIWERHVENKMIADSVSEESYLMSLQQQTKEHVLHKQVKALQFLCMKQLAGLDVYWPGKVEDKPTRPDPGGLWYRKLRPNTSVGHWGTLKVYPFPFTGVFRYDDSDDFAIFSCSPVVNRIRRFPEQGLAQMNEFAKVNMDEKIVAIRDLRIKLRSLDEQTITVRVKFPSPRDVKGTFYMIQKWQEHDIWKNPRTNEVLSMSPGFDFKIETTTQGSRQSKLRGFVCGDPEDGVHPDNFVKQADEEIDETKPNILSRESMGIEHDHFDGQDRVMQKLASNQNLDQTFLDYVRKLMQSYRDQQLEDFVWKKRTLSYEFWYYVYNNHLIKKRDLNATLAKYEDPDSLLVRDLVRGTAKVNHGHLVEDLYQRLTIFDNSLRYCMWTLFWHAVEMNNKARNYELLPKAIAKMLDPSEPGAPCTAVLTRPELERLLIEHDLTSPDLNDGVITFELLDALYDKLAEVDAYTLDTITNKWMKNVKKRKAVMGRKEAREGVEQLLAFQREHDQEVVGVVEIDEDELLLKQAESRDACSRLCGKGSCALM